MVVHINERIECDIVSFEFDLSSYILNLINLFD